MKKIFCITFITILIIPNIITFSGVEKKFPNLENRKFKNFKEINFTNPIKAAKDFKAFYNDNFGYKRTVFKFYSYLKNDLLNQNPLPNKVVFGKNGWYFLGNDAQNAFDNSVFNNTLSSFELEKSNSNLEMISKKIKTTGIPFYFFIPPNKHQVCKEQLPFNINSQNTKFSSLLTDWKNELNIIYPLSNLKSTTLKKQTYHKTDSHWNDYGALIGFQSLVNEIKKRFEYIEIPTIENYYFDFETVSKMDLTSMINKAVIENKLILKSKTKTKSYLIKKRSYTCFKNESKSLKVIVFKDSFSNAMAQFYRDTFGETIFIKSHIPDFKIIEKEKPDLVIWQMVERNLNIISQKKFFD